MNYNYISGIDKWERTESQTSNASMGLITNKGQVILSFKYRKSKLLRFFIKVYAWFYVHFVYKPNGYVY